MSSSPDAIALPSADAWTNSRSPRRAESRIALGALDHLEVDDSTTVQKPEVQRLTECIPQLFEDTLRPQRERSTRLALKRREREAKLKVARVGIPDDKVPILQDGDVTEDRAPGMPTWLASCEIDIPFGLRDSVSRMSSVRSIARTEYCASGPAHRALGAW